MVGIVEVRRFEATCPAGTPKATPLTISLAMPVRTVNSIRIRVPPGPNGVMGFALGAAGARIIPINDGEFIVAADEIFNLVLPDQIDSGAWQVQMYNTGVFDHTIYIDFVVQLPDAPTPAAVSVLDAAALSSTPT